MRGSVTSSPLRVLSLPSWGTARPVSWRSLPVLCCLALCFLALGLACARSGWAQNQVTGQINPAATLAPSSSQGTAAGSAGGASGRADGWHARFAGHPGGPSEFLAITKQKQELYFFEQKSPLAMVEKLTCTTGEREGDKLTEGDLRTPEGVYFIESRLEGGLDFDLYGTLAHTLNYPNPVDKLKGKTGGGIWIHGRGHQIVPRETKGCVALNNDVIISLDKRLRKHMPVLIANDLSWAPESTEPKELGDSNRVMQRSEAWVKEWQARSDAFFSFFDPERFSKSGDESFVAFKAHKENLFRTLPWIHIEVGEIRALPGPDYWVTWFEQFYRSPTLVSGGVKRLYWMKDGQGEWRIVGHEWIDADASRVRAMEASYLLERVQEMRAFVNAWREAWRKADLDAYMRYYDEAASQAGRNGKAAIRDHKVAIWKDKRPTKVVFGDLDVKLHPQGLEVGFTQEYEDAKGFKDKGYKTLVLQPHADGWRILSEEWRSL